MPFPPGHLQHDPVADAVTVPLGLDGYELLVDLAGTGVGRLGQQAFLAVAPDSESPAADFGTQVVLHQTRLRNDRELKTFVQLAGQLAYLRLAGYRMVLEQTGLRSRLHVWNPADGKVVLLIPEKHPAGFFGGGARSSPGMLAIARALPPSGVAIDLGNPDLGQALVSLALADDEIDGDDAVTVAQRAVTVMQRDPTLDPSAALSAAKLP